MKQFHLKLAALLAVSVIGCQSRQPPSQPQPIVARSPSGEQETPTSQPPAEDQSPTLGITSSDLDRIETELKIKLPAEYRQFMPTRSKEIAGYTYLLRGKTEYFLDNAFFLDVDRLISENLGQREADGAAADAFPNWWKEYFLFGTNGGGDYYALRLDGKPGVWFMDCDGATNTLYSPSLEDYLAKRVAAFPKEQEQYERLEKLWQQKVYGEIGEEEFKQKWQSILDEP